MATSDTTSGQTQWAPLGLWTQSSSSPPSADASDSIIVAATSRSPTTINGLAAAKGSISSTTQPNIEGRVGKSAGRRRTRASRRAPTTMLNTDTANFRSMVQQFTGIMSGPYPYPMMDPIQPITGYNFNEPISSVHRPSAMPLELQQQFQYYAQQQSHHGHGHGHAPEQQQASQNESFVPESNNSSANLGLGDEFFADAMYAQWMPTTSPTSNPNIKVDHDFYF
ncbi:uncharacterized protein LOC141816089 [Curcuma longa]|uniref:uncharacterized protein LOC141816089 n=1 Tax=Curcuma longa TaxID=136217 RepID=UPI003D9DD9F0